MATALGGGDGLREPLLDQQPGPTDAAPSNGEPPPGAKTAEPTPPVFGPVVAICGLGLCNSKTCGCQACARADKSMIMTLTFIIVLLVVALVTVILAEASALSRAGEATETGVLLARSYLSLFVGAFSFLGYGSLALIGAVRSHDPDKQAAADRKTGRIVQVCMLIAVVCGFICIGVVLGSYKAFLRHVVSVSEAGLDAAGTYLHYLAPTLPLVLSSLVFQSFCLQSGYLALVVADAVLDIVVFTTLVLAWAKQAPPEDVVMRLGASNLAVQIIKWLCYAAFCLRAPLRRRFGLLNFKADGSELRGFLTHLRGHVGWQWLQAVSQSLVALVALAVANKLSENDLIALVAAGGIVGILTAPGSLLAAYVNYFGSRFLGDRRYAAFWGLYRCTLIWLAGVQLLAFAFYKIVRHIAVDAVAYTDTDRSEIKHILEGSDVEGTIIFGIVATSAVTYLRGLYAALHGFKHICIAYLLSYVLVGIPITAAALAHNNFLVLLLGNILVPALLFTCGLGLHWFFGWLPDQRNQHRRMLEDDSRQRGKPNIDWLKLHEALGWPDVDGLFAKISASRSRLETGSWPPDWGRRPTDSETADTGSINAGSPTAMHRV